MSVIRAIRDHIKTCPFISLSDSQGFGVDFLAEDDTAYMLEAVPASPLIKRYINGDAEMQEVFAFSTRESYGSDAEQNLANTEFLVRFSEWLVKQKPSLGEGKEAVKFEVLSSTYAYYTEKTKAQYRAQYRLIYQQKGN